MGVWVPLSLSCSWGQGEGVAGVGFSAIFWQGLEEKLERMAQDKVGLGGVFGIGWLWKRNGQWKPFGAGGGGGVF